MSTIEDKVPVEQDTGSTSVSHQITIVLNGTQVKVREGRKYSYEDLFALAFPGETIPPDYAEPITYSRPRQHTSGSLLPGQFIELHDGEVINVVPTHKS